MSRSIPNRQLGDGPFGIRGQFQDLGELAANLQLTYQHANRLKIDAGGSARDIALPLISTAEGMFYEIANWSSGAENLVLKKHASDGGETVVTISQNDVATVWLDAGVWKVFKIVVTAQS